MSESKRSYRRFTLEEKRTILEEANQPNVSVAEVCRKNKLSPTLLYSWRSVAQTATTEALSSVDARGRKKPDAYSTKLEAELETLYRVVTELTTENLELKKRI